MRSNSEGETFIYNSLHGITTQKTILIIINPAFKKISHFGLGVECEAMIVPKQYNPLKIKVDGCEKCCVLFLLLSYDR